MFSFKYDNINKYIYIVLIRISNFSNSESISPEKESAEDFFYNFKNKLSTEQRATSCVQTGHHLRIVAKRRTTAFVRKNFRPTNEIKKNNKQSQEGRRDERPLLYAASALCGGVRRVKLAAAAVDSSRPLAAVNLLIESLVFARARGTRLTGTATGAPKTKRGRGTRRRRYRII